MLVHDALTLTEHATCHWVGAEFAWPSEDCRGPPAYAMLQEALRSGEAPDGLLARAQETGWTGRLDEDALRRAFEGSATAGPPRRRRGN